MRWPFVTRARYEALAADRERLRGERDQFLKDRNTAQAAERTAAALFTRADNTLAAISKTNECLTADLDAARKQLAEVKAQASDSAAERWRAEAKREKKRADRLQRQYDDAVGMNTARGDRGLYDSEHWKPPVSLDAKGAAS